MLVGADEHDLAPVGLCAPQGGDQRGEQGRVGEGDAAEIDDDVVARDGEHVRESVAGRSYVGKIEVTVERHDRCGVGDLLGACRRRRD